MDEGTSSSGGDSGVGESASVESTSVDSSQPVNYVGTSQMTEPTKLGDGAAIASDVKTYGDFGTDTDKLWQAYQTIQKDYENLRALSHKRADHIAEDILINRAKGLIEKHMPNFQTEVIAKRAAELGLIQTPKEDFSDLDQQLTDLNLTPWDDSDPVKAEYKANFLQMAKDLKLSDSQFTKGLGLAVQLARSIADEHIAQYGRKFDAAEQNNQINALVGKHGNERAGKIIATVDNALNYFPSDFLKRAPLESAAGYEFLYTYLTQMQGRSAETNPVQQHVTKTITEIESEMHTILKSGKLGRDPQLDAKYYQLAELKARARGAQFD